MNLARVRWKIPFVNPEKTFGTGQCKFVVVSPLQIRIPSPGPVQCVAPGGEVATFAHRRAESFFQFR